MAIYEQHINRHTEVLQAVSAVHGALDQHTKQDNDNFDALSAKIDELKLAEALRAEKEAAGISAGRKWGAVAGTIATAIATAATYFLGNHPL